MTCSNTPHLLWQLYRQTIFLHQAPLPSWHTFLVLTADNPRGCTLSAHDNACRQSQLERSLKARGLAYSPIVGAAPDLSHSEASYMILCTYEQAIKLAAEFEQNALFWVERGQLWLIPCLLKEVEPQSLGAWSERVQLSESLA